MKHYGGTFTVRYLTMMNTYAIAPRMTKIAMDEDLLCSFPLLRSKLRWRPLTTNLESCEDGGYLYFRITLRLGNGSTYAGFATGAPFMLTRDIDVKKKTFFLRHWVRQVPEDKSVTAISKPEYVWLAIVEDIMIVRVDIDREMTLQDTFKSVPFATWMFQVMQIDALVENAPGVRFAFAIERTVTPDERAKITANVEHTRAQTRIQKAASRSAAQRVAPIRAVPRPMPPPPTVTPQPKVEIASKLPPTGKKQTPPQQASVAQNTDPKTVAPVLQPRTTQQKPAPVPRAAVPIASAPVSKPVAVAPAPTPVHAPVPTQLTPIAPSMTTPSRTVQRGSRSAQNSARGYAMASSAGPNTISASSGVLPEKRLSHPYLRLWENRALNDPYQPIFIVDSDELTEKSKKTWRVEPFKRSSRQFAYERLQSLPGADYPTYFWDATHAHDGSDVNDDLVIVYPAKRAKLPEPDAGEEEKGDNSEDTSLIGDYIAAVKAAAEYNTSLASDRTELHSWLFEDEKVREESGKSKAEEDNESSSSG